MYRAASKAIIRIPLLPLSFLKNIRLEELSEATIINALSVLCTDNVIEAIYVSSPEFARKIEFIINNLESKFELEKLLPIWLTFSKYYTRMCSRATPYGLMASVGVINFEGKTTVKNNFEGIVHAQLDNSVVYDISNKLQENEKIQENLRYFPNPSIYHHGNSLKYIEAKDEFNGQRSFSLSKIQKNLIINKLLNFTTHGKNKKAISDFLEIEFGTVYAREDIDKLISELIINQLLLSNYSSKSTRKTLFSCIVDDLKKIPENIDSVQKVFFIDDKLSHFTKQDWSTNKHLINAIEIELKNLDCDINKIPLCVNLIRSFSKSSINFIIENKVRTVTNLLAKINERSETTSLEQFKKIFSERYENQYVPLSELLDEEIGIGYPVGNIRNSNADGVFDDVILSQNIPPDSPSGLFNTFHGFLLKKISDIKKGQIIELTSTELEVFATTDIKLPPTYSIYCTLLGIGTSEIDNGDFNILLTSGNPVSAVNPINRFSISDDEIAELCKEIVVEEDNLFRDKIVAEVVHVPHTRLDNITFRAISRDYEIPIESLSSLRNDNKIHLDEILVNVVDNEIKLLSKVHKKEIVPKISNSHAFDNLDSLPAYKFLGDLQLDGQQNNLLWHWGPLSRLEFLPRVVIDNNLICSLATWKITLDKSFYLNPDRQSDRLKDELINKGLPQCVSLRQNGDHLLMLDLEDPTCLLILLKEFKKYSQLTFHEYLPKQANVFLKDKEGNGYVHELVIPFIRRELEQESRSSKFSRGRRESLTEKRVFFPGEDFNYIKIYCTRNIGQKILIEKLSKLFLEFEKTGDIAFFIRYEDPDFHLRIRVYKKDNLNIISKLYAILKKDIANKLIYNITLDTYKREINRYFEISYNKTELIFSFDSIAIVKILKFLNKNGYESYTWIIAMKNIYSYLKNFAMDLDEMLTFCLAIKNDFFIEFGLYDKDFVKSMNAKLKKNKDLIDSIVNGTNTDFKEFNRILFERENKVSNILTIIEREKIKGNRTQLFSYIHMSVNRLFSSDQRLKEAMCYDLLYNYLVYKKIQKNRDH